MLKWEKGCRGAFGTGGLIMARAVDGDQNVKIYILYLMDNIHYPVTFLTLNDILMESDYILYLDFAENFHKLVDDGLIRVAGKDEHGDDLYEVTDHGRLVAQELHSEILPALLRDTMKIALRYLDFKRRGVIWGCHVAAREDGRFDVCCEMKEKGVEILHINIVVDSMVRAKAMKKNVDDHPQIVYRSTMALLSGEVNYMFDK